SIAQRTTIDGNQINSIVQGNPITFGNINLSGPFPGACTINQNRLCLTNSDCNIPGYDTSSQGTCSGVVSHTVASVSYGGVITNNTITGPFIVALTLATPNILVQGNTITGPIVPGTDFTSTGGVGIQLQGNGTTTATITKNVISNVA